jgi:hypothetical protein
MLARGNACLQHRRSPGRAENHDVLLAIQAQVFENDVPGLFVEVRGHHGMVPAAPVDIGIGRERLMHCSFDLLQGVRHPMNPSAMLVHREHRYPRFVSPIDMLGKGDESMRVSDGERTCR